MKICTFVSLGIMVLFFFPIVVDLCLSVWWLDCVRIVWPLVTATCISLFIRQICRAIHKSGWWAVCAFSVVSVGFKVTSDNTYAMAENTELSEGTFWINTGKRCSTYREPGLPRGVKGDSWSLFLSFQIGVNHQAKAIGDVAVAADTVLLKISNNHKLQIVLDLAPSPSDIQKYMEPVLFIDGVEQPRPGYDGLGLSETERRWHLCRYHLQVAEVVKTERDNFLRNLVTLQVNDTLRQTVNLMYKDERDYDDIFESLTADSRVIIKVSDIDPRIVKVVNWRPDESSLAKISEQQHVDAEIEKELMFKSSKLLGVIEGRFVKKRRPYVIVRVGDSVRMKLELTDEKAIEMFDSLREGDNVLVRQSDIFPQVFRILSWRPTPEEIEKYRTPLRLIEKPQ